MLSPAGGWASLKAAIAEGADAVYFGTGKFNARRRAENFSEEELAKVSGYCHNYGVRAYLTANTLVKNSELAEYFRLLENAYASGIDAVIIQELSFIQLIKKSLPGMNVHVSTQAGVFNSYYRNLVEGADRIILPREFTLAQVRDFHEKTKLPVEVFVQGALCYSISGQCLMSSFMGGRSGNRGFCAQPCRKIYNGVYALSTKDLCTIEKLPAIVEAGVCSLKIEGRLRSPQYVGAATALYRRELDTLSSGRYAVDEDALVDMTLAFNREYTPGKLFKEDDLTTPGAGGKRGIIVGKLGNGGLIKPGTSLRIGDGVGIITKKGVHGDVIRMMEKNGVPADRAEKGQAVKLFINAKPGDGIILTSGVRRRSPCKPSKLTRITISRNKNLKIRIPTVPEKYNTAIKLLVKVYSPSDAHAAHAAGADRVYYNLFAKDYPKEEFINPYIPRCLDEWNAAKAITLVEELKPSSVLSGDLGVATQFSCETYLDVSCNAFNDLDVAYYQDKNITPVISPELSFRELGAFKDKRFAVYAHGRLPLMTTKYPLKEKTLTDERGFAFPVRSELDYRQIINSIPLGLYNDVLTLKKHGIMEYFLDLTENVSETITAYRNILAGRMMKLPKEHTRGNYLKGID